MSPLSRVFAIVLFVMPSAICLAVYGWRSLIVAVGAVFGGAFIHLWGYERGLEEGRKR